jgi:hypothetical protein
MLIKPIVNQKNNFIISLKSPCKIKEKSIKKYPINVKSIQVDISKIGYILLIFSLQ